MQKVTPFLWFDGQAKEAMAFYVSIFKNSKIVSGNRFQLDGQEFMVLNGGPQFKFTEAISLFVNCETQEEVDELWEKLSEGGEKGRCGWLKDKFGLSWQVIPSILGKMLHDKDAEKAKRVMKAMLQMNKIDIKVLQQEYDRGTAT
jgi:predicted 3-demethylubiquinone-9 3-methyltransferase (glyoxalase superfamily)